MDATRPRAHRPRTGEEEEDEDADVDATRPPETGEGEEDEDVVVVVDDECDDRGARYRAKTATVIDDEPELWWKIRKSPGCECGAALCSLMGAVITW